MILAAGRGARLRPLTDSCPKALIQVGKKPLIVYHLEKLKKAGVSEVVINVCHLGEQIVNFLGNGAAWGLDIVYSFESSPLEVGGGIFQALSLLGEAPFMVINSDIWTHYPFEKLLAPLSGLGHLVLVDNPLHHQQGDFCLAQGKLHTQGQTYTYSGMAVLHPSLFVHCAGRAFALAPLLHKALSQGLLSGEYYEGQWVDVGTLQRLQGLEKVLVNEKND